jgi:hypothetical protein
MTNFTSDTQTTASDMQNIQHAQRDMRIAHLHGFSGVVVSGLVWFIAGLVAIYASPKQAVWALLIGGVCIYPLSVVFNKILGASGTHASNNPLTNLAMEGTIFMIMCLPLAYALSFQKVEWFFQGMLIIIGGRYLTFSTLYGTRLYWVLGIGLAMAAWLLFMMKASSSVSILVGATIEITFGFMMLFKTRRSIS